MVETSNTVPADKTETVVSRYLPIRDYAVIGDCHGAALIGRNGSVDWCCLGRFDADPIFFRILDAKQGGSLTISLDHEYRTERAYLPGTNILSTTFSTDSGCITLTDFMPVGRIPEASTHDYVNLAAPGWLIRIVEGVSGTVDFSIGYQPTPAFGHNRQSLSKLQGQIATDSGPQLYHDLPEVQVNGDRAEARVTLTAGSQHILIVTNRPISSSNPIVHAQSLLEITRAFWEEWIAYCRYEGPYRDAVRRSALALKLLTYAPTGAIAAAATTSLPEEIGGKRNWDYRYCWLRDSAFTLYALAALGYGGEAKRFSEFLSKVCSATFPDLHIMYGIGGEVDLSEHELIHLDGYSGSRPVRIGNGAFEQRQIDIYGEVLDWAHVYVALGGKFERDSRGMLEAAANFAAMHWREPDHGLWEMRGPPLHHVHGKMMSWVAIDRAIRLFGSRPEWEEAREQIVADVLEKGVDANGGHLLQSYGSSGTDAALLLAPIISFPLDKAMLVATVEAVERELRHGDFVYRYKGEDGLEGGEGAFLICSFWLVNALLHVDRYDEAKLMFERLLICQNDVGLYAEEIDPETGAFLGNFPQAFTHLSLISVAVHLELYKCGGIEAIRGGYANRAKRHVTATMGWRALWAAFRKTFRIGRIFSSKHSVLRIDSLD